MGEADRSTIARMLSQAYENAIHDALCVLHDHEVPGFDTAYEGTPFHDFIGRLSGEWAWPDVNDLTARPPDQAGCPSWRRGWSRLWVTDED